jgi:RNA polymerase sigma-70 factor (ECF subfamily)
MDRHLEQSAATIETSLLARVRQQDQEAWRRLEYLFGPLVLQWLRQAGVAEADAVDLRQEVLQAVWKSVGRFERERAGSTFRGWLRTITQNKLRDHLRARRHDTKAEGGTEALWRIGNLPEDLDELSSQSGNSNEELQGLVRRAIDLVKDEVQPHTWQAFWLVVVEGRTAAEAARQLGIKPGSVYTARSRVLNRLREALGPDFESVLKWK